MTGGAGGDGSVTVTNVQSELNYPEKEIEILVGQSYEIDRAKIRTRSEERRVGKECS